MLTYQKLRLLTDSNFLKLASTFYEIQLKSRYNQSYNHPWERASWELKSPTREVGNQRFSGFRVGVFGSRDPLRTHAVRGGFQDRVGNLRYFLSDRRVFRSYRVFYPLTLGSHTSQSNFAQRKYKKHRFYTRARFFVTKTTLKLPTGSHIEWDLKLQTHAPTHVGSGTFRRNRVGGAHPTWGYPRVGLALVPVRSSRSKNQASQRRTFVDDDEEFDFG